MKNYHFIIALLLVLTLTEGESNSLSSTRVYSPVSKSLAISRPKGAFGVEWFTNTLFTAQSCMWIQIHECIETHS